MAKKQESEKFTGFAGTYSWSNKVLFDPTASPLSTDVASNPFMGADEQSRGVSSSDSGLGNLRPKTIGHTRILDPGKKGGGYMYNIIRPIFSFDFTDPEEYGDGQLKSVKKIQKAKVVLNISSVTTKAGKSKPTPPTKIDIALMCAKTQPSIVTTSKPGKGGNPPITSTTTTLPLASQALSVGGFAVNANGLGATSEIISSTNTVSVGDTGQIGFNLPRPMLDELQAAMQQRRYFSVFVIDDQSYNGNISAANFNGNQTVIFHAVATNAALQPILDFSYSLDNNKINQGAGISRSSKSGFMTDNVFSGTNSGFSE